MRIIVKICIIRSQLESFFALFLYLQTECFASASRTAHELRPIVLKVWWLTTTTSYNAPPQRTTGEAEKCAFSFFQKFTRKKDCTQARKRRFQKDSDTCERGLNQDD